MNGLKIKYFIAGTLFVLLAGAMACKKDQDYSGPEVAAAKEGFALTKEFAASSQVVNFQSEKLSFSADFNQKVSWDLQVKGLSSGAVKSYKGLGEYFNETEVVFDGRSSTTRFFNADEYVSAELTILGLDSAFVIDSIQTKKGYSYHSKEINGVKHILVDDFERGNTYNKVSLAVSPDQKDSEIDFVADTNLMMQGERSYKMSGQDDNNNGWIGGMNSENLVDFYLYPNNQSSLIDSGIDPSELYFNIYIYGSGTASTAVQLKVYEFDHKTFMQGDTLEVPLKDRSDMRDAIYKPGVGGPPTARNPYDQSVNDGWIFDIEVSWTGWKLASVPYSSFRAANEFAMGAGGDRIKESWRICGMAISLLAFPTTGIYAETYGDYLVITQGGKFQK